MKYLLVIEDDGDIRDVLCEMLELAGYEVQQAANGKEGLKSILEKRPDLVLCDVDMPMLNGFELLEVLNTRLKNEVIPPFVFLTAKVEKSDIRMGMNLGADDYILKPFKYSELLKVVELRLKKRQKMLEGKIKNVESLPKRLALPTKEGLELFYFSTIVSCRAERAYCTFYLLDNRKIIVSKSMKVFEEQLLKNNFIKVHKSTIVNIGLIKKYVNGKGGYLIMSDGSTVDVSVRRKDTLISVLQNR